MTALQEHRDFLSSVRQRQADRHRALSSISSAVAGPSQTPTPASSKDNVVNYVPGEETVRNDYTAWYGISGRSGADYILGAKDEQICSEYPALRRLMNLKQQLIDVHSHPPLYAYLSNTSSDEIYSTLAPSRFDVILIKPTGTWDETAALPIRNLSADPGFVFLWVGRGDQEGLERGRECLAQWGFRRAEDIVWLKTTPASGARRGEDDADKSGGFRRGGLLASQKEHCLMGIRGTVRRSTDHRFVHCNVDTDVMIWDDSDPAGLDFPPYLYTLIESFCLGTRRLQLFTVPSSSRRGWITASTQPPPPSTELYIPSTYLSVLPPRQEGRDILPFHPEIEMLRPKSPTKNRSRNPPTNRQTPIPQPTFGSRTFSPMSTLIGGIPDLSSSSISFSSPNPFPPIQHSYHLSTHAQAFTPAPQVPNPSYPLHTASMNRHRSGSSASTSFSRQAPGTHYNTPEGQFPQTVPSATGHHGLTSPTFEIRQPSQPPAAH